MDKLVLPPISDTEVAFTRMLSAGNYAAAVNILILCGFSVQFYTTLDAKNLDMVMANLRTVIAQVTQRYAPNQPLQCEPESAAYQVEYLTERVMRLVDQNRALERKILELKQGLPWWKRVSLKRKG